MTLWRISSILSLLLAFSAVSAFAQAAPKAAGKPALAYLCSNVSGATVMAPRWQSETDAVTGQDVRLVFGGPDEPASVVWRRGDTTYYESDGVGLSLKAGFAILVLAEDRIETYVYSAGTTELLFTSTRLGSSILPNAVKAFRGTCVPDGSKREE